MGKHAVNKAERYQRVREALRLRLQGKTESEIAAEMQFNINTIHKYLEMGFTYNEKSLREYCKEFIMEAKREKDISDEELYQILFNGKTPQAKLQAARELRENKKTIFDILLKTGSIDKVTDKVEVELNGSITLKEKMRAIRDYIMDKDQDNADK